MPAKVQPPQRGSRQAGSQGQSFRPPQPRTLAALALLPGAGFAPLARQCWLLASAAAADGLIFTGVVRVKFVLA